MLIPSMNSGQNSILMNCLRHGKQWRAGGNWRFDCWMTRCAVLMSPTGTEVLAEGSLSQCESLGTGARAHRGRLTDGRHLSGAWGGRNAQKKPRKERATKGNIPEMCACWVLPARAGRVQSEIPGGIRWGSRTDISALPLHSWESRVKQFIVLGWTPWASHQALGGHSLGVKTTFWDTEITLGLTQTEINPPK